MALVEGTQLNLCKNCGKYGKKISRPRPTVTKKTFIKVEQKQEKEELIVIDYADRIRKKRESLGIKQEDFAKQVHEKESILQKIEAGQFKPSIKLARKLERLLNIKLIEEYEDKHVQNKKSASQGMTIGDLIKLK